MLINIFYDEEPEIADIIELPEDLDVEQLERDFLSWMFNKNNNHKYWVYENGIKQYCSYGTSAFVEWMNLFIFNNDERKARILEEYSKNYNVKDCFIIF